MKPTTPTLPAASLLLLLGTGLGHAQIITPVGVMATSSLDENRDIAHTISGAGLSGGGGPILDQTHNINVNGTYWLGAIGDGQVLTFDLGGANDVQFIHIWQYQRDNQWDDRSIQSFDIAYSTDGGSSYSAPVAGPAGLIGSQTDPIANPVPVQTLDLGSVQSGVTHVQLTNIQNFGDGTWLGLAEIRFGSPGTGPNTSLGDPDVTVLAYDLAEATSFLSGEDAATVTLYWGTEDKGETDLGWDGGSQSFGAHTAGGPIPDPAAWMDLLTQGTTYYCRFYAESATSAETTWSNAASFTTPNALELINPTTTYLAFNEADVTVTTNLDTDTMDLYWGTTDPGATTTGWDNGPVNLGAQFFGPILDVTLTGLSENTEYVYRFHATSSSPVASSDWSNAGRFTTPLENPPPVITPANVTATSSLIAYQIVYTIDSSGLNSAGASPLDWTHDGTPANTNDKSWLGNRAGTEIIYELPGVSTVTYLYFWSYWGGTATRSLTSFDISFSSNGVDYSGPSTITLGTPGSAAEGFDLGTQADVTHVKFDNLQNGGDSLAGIGEVRFGGTTSAPAPDPVIARIRHLGGSVELDLAGLDSGATYKLFRDTVLPLGESKVQVGADVINSTTATVTDFGPLPPDAFYQAEQQ